MDRLLDEMKGMEQLSEFPPMIPAFQGNFIINAYFVVRIVEMLAKIFESLIYQIFAKAGIILETRSSNLF